MTAPRARLRDLLGPLADAIVDEVTAPTVTKAAGARELTVADRAATRRRVLAVLRPLDEHLGDLDHRFAAQFAMLDQLQAQVDSMQATAHGAYGPATTADRLRALLAGDDPDDRRTP